MQKEISHKLWKPVFVAGMFLTAGCSEVSSQQSPRPITDENCKANLMPPEELQMLGMYAKEYGYENIPAENMGKVPSWMEYTRSNCSELPPPTFPGSSLAEFVNSADYAQPVPLPPTPPPSQDSPQASPPPTMPAVETQPTAPAAEQQSQPPHQPIESQEQKDDGLLKKTQKAVGILLSCLSVGTTLAAGALWSQQKSKRKKDMAERNQTSPHPQGIEGGRPVERPKTRREKLEEKGRRLIERRQRTGPPQVIIDPADPKNTRIHAELNFIEALRRLFRFEPGTYEYKKEAKEARTLLTIIRAFNKGGPLDPYAHGLAEEEYYEPRVGEDQTVEKYDPEYPYHTEKKIPPETGLESDDY